MAPELNAAPELAPTGAGLASTRPETSGLTQPLHGGRYHLEFQPYACPRCLAQTSHAFLWLLFLVAEVETDREVSDVVCSRCEPERFTRLQALAPYFA